MPSRDTQSHQHVTKLTNTHQHAATPLTSHHTPPLAIKRQKNNCKEAKTSNTINNSHQQSSAVTHSQNGFGGTPADHFSPDTLKHACSHQPQHTKQHHHPRINSVLAHHQPSSNMLNTHTRRHQHPAHFTSRQHKPPQATTRHQHSKPASTMTNSQHSSSTIANSHHHSPRAINVTRSHQ